MKQHITIEQLNELTYEQKQKLFRWQVNRKDVDLGEYLDKLPDIGQLIEFLDNNDSCDWILDGRSGYIELSWKNHSHTIINWDGELCDALWEAVKEIL